MDKDSENDILMRLKSQAKLLQQEGVNSQNDNCSSSSSKLSKDSMMSLVPGYEDDSDGEDETSSKSRKNVASKPLFPIPESPSTEVKRIETGTASIKIYDYRNQEATVTLITPSEPNMEQEDSNKSSAEDKQLPEEGKVDIESKANHFLDSIDTPAKGFQRKKRIAFDGLYPIVMSLVKYNFLIDIFRPQSLRTRANREILQIHQHYHRRRRHRRQSQQEVWNDLG